MQDQRLKDLLDEKYHQYNRLEFIEHDPICIPHRFQKLQDIEISAFWVAILAWGQRKTIINKATDLMRLMDDAPYQFVTQHQDSDLKRLESFKHRTFNATDTLYFVDFFKRYYAEHNSLELAFSTPDAQNMKERLSEFHKRFFDNPYAPQRTRKHIATPARKSACKRLNMFLRWMVRKDHTGVDFGLWDNLNTRELICPCDVHVERVARKLGLIQRNQVDWEMAEELTANLRLYDPHDPVKYDFALFGMGVMED